MHGRMHLSRLSTITRRFVVLLSSLLCVWQAYGDVFTEYLTGKGVGAIVVDTADSTKRLVWFGTDNSGLISFDGSRFKEFNISNTNGGLGDNWILSLAMDSQRRMWIGTFRGGVSRFDIDNDRWKRYDSSTGLTSNNKVRAILIDEDGRVWFGTDAGLGLYDGRNWYRYTTTQYAQWDSVAKEWKPLKDYGPRDSKLVDNLIYALATDAQGNIWIGTDSSLSILNPGSHVFTSYKIGRVTSIYRDSREEHWLGSHQTIYHVTTGDQSRIVQRIDTPCTLIGHVYSIIEDQENRLWFGTDYGASRLDKNKQFWRCSTGSADLDTKEIRAMAIDDDGNMWFGSTGTPSVTRYATNWLSFSKSNSDSLKSDSLRILDDTIHDMAVDHPGQVWIATTLGVARFDGSVWRPRIYFGPIPEFALNHTAAIEVDSSGTLWLASLRGGVVHIRPDGSEIDRFNVNNTNRGLVSNFVTSIAIDGDSSLWFGTDRGLSRLRFESSVALWDTFTVASTARGLVDNQVFALAVDLEGRLWCSTGLGLCRYEPQLNRWSYFYAGNTGNGLPNYGVNSITVDRQTGRVWFATAGGGASSFKNGIWELITTNDGLADNSVQDILITYERSETWFATPDGVSCLSQDGQWTKYTTIDGLADNNVSRLVAGATEGEIWFGTRSDGVTRYRRQARAPNTFISPPSELTTQPEYDFRITASSEITFRFSGTDLNTPRELLRFSYKLDNRPWSEYTSDNFARITVTATNLHTFYVKAVDKDKNEDPSPAAITFHKINPDTGICTSFRDDSGFHLAGNVTITLCWPPHLLPDTSRINISPVVSDSLMSPAILAYDFRPFSTDIKRTRVILSFAFPLSLGMENNQFTIYRELDAFGQPDGTRLGGTPGIRNMLVTVSTSIDQFGRYAVRSTDQFASSNLANIRTTAQPRVFSPKGGGHGQETTLSFHLPQSGHVKIQAYNLAGRLVKTIWDEHMNSGINAVAWDGKDKHGDTCPTGLYILIVDGEGFRPSPKPVKVMVLNE